MRYRVIKIKSASNYKRKKKNHKTHFFEYLKTSIIVYNQNNLLTNMAFDHIYSH